MKCIHKKTQGKRQCFGLPQHVIPESKGLFDGYGYVEVPQNTPVIGFRDPKTRLQPIRAQCVKKDTNRVSWHSLSVEYDIPQELMTSPLLVQIVKRSLPHALLSKILHKK